MARGEAAAAMEYYMRQQDMKEMRENGISEEEIASRMGESSAMTGRDWDRQCSRERDRG